MSKKKNSRIGACLLTFSLIGGCGGGGSADDIYAEACESGNQSACDKIGAAPTTGGGTPAPSTPTEPVAPAFAVSPSALTVGDCTTNLPFIFSGGAAPYTILTTDNVTIPVGAARPLGINNYFMASIGAVITDGNLFDDPTSPVDESLSTVTLNPPIVHTLTVLDSGGRAATTEITIPFGHVTCPFNPLLQAVPASANGGTGPYTMTSSDPSIVQVIGNATVDTIETPFNAQALTPGTALLTITSGVQNGDGQIQQRANITFTVLPPA